MMDNYEDARHDGGPLNESNILHSMEIKDRVEFLSFNNVEHGKHNDYDFGAEILNTTSPSPTMSPESDEPNEELIKTNGENINTATTTTTTTTQHIEDVLSLMVASPVATHTTCSPQQDTQDAQIVENPPDDDDDDNETNCRTKQAEQPSQDEDNDEDADADEDSDDSSTSDSDFSDLSGLSEMSGRNWKPMNTRPVNWVQRQMHSGADPRELLSQMLPSGTANIEPGINDMMLWRLLASMLTEPPRRQKLRHINTFDDVVRLVLDAKNIIVLTGAGVSVSCGIPDFRSSDGIYSRLAKDFPDLPDPQAMFDINYFSRDPRPFYKFAREIYPGQFRPSPCHRFIKLLEQKQKLLRNYTQNIDTLEQVAGIRNVIECHGSFSTASCTKCKVKCTADAIRADIFAQRIPVCHRCQPNVQQSVDASERVCEEELKRLVQNGIMKPDIVFFGEGLPEEFHTVMASDKDKCDLLIVMGSSLKVRPVALIPSSIPAHVPQILINREQLHHLDFDVELLGDSDVIINQLCHRLGDTWKEICYSDEILRESNELLPLAGYSGAGDSNSEEDGHDTQSVKSNASTDIALQSVGAYSDSGFESCTSTGGKPTIIAASSSSSPNNDAKPLKVNLLDEPADAVDFRSNEKFNAFADRLKFAGDTERHMSVDSSKDSGIQCDSIAASNQHTARLDSGGGGGGDAEPCSSSSPPSTSSGTTTCVAQSAAAKALNSKTQMTNTKTQRLGDAKDQSASERLLEGTYYRHEDTTSYVFPGAQVSWSCDSDDDTDHNEDDDDDEEDIDDDDDDVDVASVNDFDDAQCGAVRHIDIDDDDSVVDVSVSPLSPLLPPSLEAEMVNELASAMGSRTTGPHKRRSTEQAVEPAIGVTTALSATTFTSIETTFTADGEENRHLITTTNTTSAIISSSTTASPCSPPPVKKRRDSADENATDATTAFTGNPTPATTTTTTTTKTTIINKAESITRNSTESLLH